MEKSGACPRYRWFVLTAASVAIMSCYMNVVAYAPLLGQIAADLNIGMSLAMNLISVTYIVTALALLVSGFFCDKYGTKPALLFGLFLSVVPAMLVPLIGRSFYALLAVRLLQGIAPAFVLVAVGPITSFWFPAKEQGLASGLMMGSLSLGAAVGLLGAPGFAKIMGDWQGAIALLSILGWVGIVLVSLIRREPPVLSAGKGLSLPSTVQESLTVRKALLMPVTWAGALIFFFNAWGFHALYALVPAYLSATPPMGIGLTAVVSGKLSLALTVVGIFAVLAGGVVLDRVFKGNFRIVMAIGFLVTSVFSYLILLPAVFQSPTFLVLSLLLAGWGIPFMGSSTIAFCVSTYPVTMVGRMLGWLGGIGTFGGAVGVFMGNVAIARTGAFNLAIEMISLTALAGFCLSLMLRRRSTVLLPSKSNVLSIQ
ncbi:MAG: MFS transporter [Deltaproteobacteria bacterium]|nr:MFS transporter [Deltaproteobacteria bacterium]